MAQHYPHHIDCPNPHTNDTVINIKHQPNLTHSLVAAFVAYFVALSHAQASPPAPGDDPVSVFTYRAPESDSDHRYDYDTAALRLALEKTRQEYGPYRLEPSPAMTFPRAISAVSRNEYPNFFVKLSYEEEHVSQRNMTFAKFPVDLGIVGYRVCFTSPQSREKVKAAKSLDDLKKFSIGQGRGWADVEILRHNGFQVVEASNYENLFRMVANHRFDLFCRGTNELLDEYEAHRNIDNLTYDQTFSIAYPLPRFFFTHHSNKKTAERITEGLLAAFRDGSLQELWRKNYWNSINFVRLDKRRIYWLENPLLKGLGFNYRQYFFNPLSDTNYRPLVK